MSRAEMASEVAEIMLEIGAFVDKAMRLSRAELMRDLGELLGQRVAAVGHRGP